jgi:hypothetical protein
METPFTMVYGTDAMLPVEIDTPTWRRDTFSEEGIKSYIYASNLLFRRQTDFLFTVSLLTTPPYEFMGYFFEKLMRQVSLLAWM